MIISQKDLLIRNAEPTDAEILANWWNDGAVMAHAGFPNGIGTTAEQVRKGLEGENDEDGRCHIIELNGKPIGEMDYCRQDETAEIGIKICDFSEQGKGYGTRLLGVFTDALFTYYGFDKIILDTNLKNTRAQRVYEKKLGFRSLGVAEDAWEDQLGVPQSVVNYEITREEWALKPSYIHIRPERPEEYRQVEELIREAFWIGTDTGAIVSEHLLAHKLRDSSAFISELDYVAEIEGKLAGHIIYSRAEVVDEKGTGHPVISFGPLSVLPEYQSYGIGGALTRFTMALAGRLGYPGVVIYGHADYYPRFGFKRGIEFGISTPDGSFIDPLMAAELVNGGLNFGGGKFHEAKEFHELTDEAAALYDKNFPCKKPLPEAGIGILLERLQPDAKAAVEGLKLNKLEDIRRFSEETVRKLPGIDDEAVKIIRSVMKKHGRGWGLPQSF